MWGDLGWFGMFIDGIIDVVRGWFGFLGASNEVSDIVDGSQLNFGEWISEIVLPAIRNFLGGWA